MPPTPADIHELIDVVSAIQHVIVDPLNDLTSDEISRLNGSAQLCQILQNTVYLMCAVDAYNGNNSSGGGMNRAVWPNTYGVGNWAAGGTPTTQDMHAMSYNTTFQYVPGIKRSTLEGLINSITKPVKDEYDEEDQRIMWFTVSDISIDIFERLRSFLPALRRLDSMGLPRYIKGLISTFERL